MTENNTCEHKMLYFSSPECIEYLMGDYIVVKFKKLCVECEKEISEERFKCFFEKIKGDNNGQL